jgi:putative transposase
MQQAPIRKNMRRRESAGNSRFITFSCQRRLPLFKNPAIAQVFQDSLARAHQRLGFRLCAWVIMPEHIHLLVLPPDDMPLDRVLLWIKLSTAQRVIKRWRELDAPILARITRDDGRPRFWQKGGGFDRNVRDLAEFQRHVKYIHQNPVERGLVERPEAWRFSSVRWWMGTARGRTSLRSAAGRSAPPPRVDRMEGVLCEEIEFSCPGLPLGAVGAEGAGALAA